MHSYPRAKARGKGPAQLRCYQILRQNLETKFVGSDRTALAVARHGGSDITPD